MRTVTSTRARRTRTALMAVAPLLLLAVSAPAVSAHSDEGEIELTRFEQTGPERVEIEVGVVYANDGHLASDASVTAQLTHDDGTGVGPIDLTHQGEGTSLYRAAVDLSSAGSWSVTVTSTDPDASIDGTLVVDDTVATTAAPPETPDTTEATQDTSVVSPPTDNLATAAEDDTGTFVLVLLIALVVAALAGGALWWYRRRRAGDGPPPDPGH